MRTKITLILLAFVGSLNAQNPLLIPGTISGTEFDLTLQNGTYQFWDGVNTTTMGVNGPILGPTLIMDKGDEVDITVNNQLSDTTTIHWHGMHVSAENDGGPHTVILPGETWNPTFEVMDKAGTYWYHPHLHMKTNLHVSMGIAGFIIVRDDEEAALDLPRTYGVDDFPLAVQTKDFDENNQIVGSSNSDDVVMVNATIDANLDVPAQVVRFRLLNGTSQRVLNFGLSGNAPFYQIGSDGGLLSNAIELTRLELPPGARAEILIDFSNMQGQNMQLMSYASEFPNGIYGATYPGTMTFMELIGYNPNPINGADFNLMQFTVVAPNGNPVTTIPDDLVTVTPIPEASADTIRTLEFTPEAMGPNQLNGLFLINGVSYDMDVINITVPLDNIEIWSISNQTAIAHPFHIHDVQFFVLDRNGVAPPLSEQGRKDDILVKPQETVRFITQFSDFANDPVPYMYHCHMLVHEDGGMMGQFEVVDNTIGIDENAGNSMDVSLYPNPVSGMQATLGFPGKNTYLLSYEIYNTSGGLVASKTIDKKINALDIDLKGMNQGIYFLKVYTKDAVYFKKLIRK
ncbi:MAG: multicopper oxidase domain-containing protein [Chlorobi bacterium]|nr:multicopper oxidase domain-containing protein [Chlorobiota bacterium]